MRRTTGINMTDNLMEDRHAAQMLHLCRLVSPSLPVGAYAFSGGLEHAVTAGWVEDEDGARDWIFGQLEHAQSRLDVPVLARLYRGLEARDRDSVVAWSALLLAARESAELQAADRRMGLALARLLADLGVPDAGAWRDDESPCFAGVFALACLHWEIPLAAAARGLLWSWTENQVAAAIKLVPLGQTAGQRMLVEASARIPACIARGLALDDDEIGAIAPGVAIASALHETQHTRLFQS